IFLDGTSPLMIRQKRQPAISQSPPAWDYDHPASNLGDRCSISLAETISLQLAVFVKKSVFSRAAPETQNPLRSPSRGPERLRAGDRRPARVLAPTSPPRDSQTSRLWPSGNASASAPLTRPLLSAR